MTTQPLISVIIPFFNVEKYIKQCLNSVTKQSYHNLEIILVDDGSCDSTRSIINKFQKNDPRIVVISQDNQGQGAARNNGIRHAHGDYITFVDADDYVTTDYVEYLFNLLKNNHFRSPLAICSFTEEYTATNRRINKGNGTNQTLSGEQCLNMMCHDQLVNTCAYTKLGKRELFSEHFFPEHVIYEDLGAIYQLFEQSSSVECGFHSKYFYQIHENTTLSQKFNPAMLDAITMANKMASSVNHRFPELSTATAAAKMSIYLSLMNQLVGHKQERIQKKIVSFIRENSKTVLKDKRYPIKKKIAILALMFGSGPYSFALQFYSKVTGKKRI